MRSTNHAIKNSIINAALPDVPFDGWTLKTLENAAEKSGHSKDMVRSVFPKDVKDALVHFAAMADEAMIDSLSDIDSQNLKVRERVSIAVEKRLLFLAKYREAERLAVSYWMRPMRKFDGAKIVWTTADVIWDWAGDTATDYSRVTRRTLLSGVLVATTLFWLNDKTGGMNETKAFLARRIENVMTLGKMASKLKRAS